MSIVDVFVSNGQAMIWNPNGLCLLVRKLSVCLLEECCDTLDAVKLRKDHRIIATPVGSLPRNSKQNVCLGLPLLLMPEQATLLAEKSEMRMRLELVLLTLSTSDVEHFGFVDLVRLRSYRMPPKASQEQVDFFEKEREESVKQQVGRK